MLRHRDLWQRGVSEKWDVECISIDKMPSLGEERGEKTGMSRWPGKLAADQEGCRFVYHAKGAGC